MEFPVAKKPAPALAAAPAPTSSPPTGHTLFEYVAKVVRVLDGDTVEVDIQKDVGFGIHMEIRKQVRMLGINAPESSGATAKEGLASKALLSTLLVPGTAILMKTAKPDPKDKYGRFLATLWLDGLNLNEHMVVAGAAVAYDGGKR